MFIHIYKILKPQQFFYKYQTVISTEKSTFYQLLDSKNSIMKSSDDGNYYCIIIFFCDISKAFDCLCDNV